MKANSAPSSAIRRSVRAGLTAFAAILFTAATGLAAAPPTQQAYVKASNTGAGDSFGIAVAVDGNTMLIGAPDEASNSTGVNGNQADNSAASSGAVYVFVRSGGVWVQQAYLKASNSEVGDRFGSSVSISGDTLVVGSPHEGSNATGVNGDQGNNDHLDSGAAYVFVRNGTNWSQQAYFKAFAFAADVANFGQSVAVSSDTVVVGGYRENTLAYNSGAAYVFVRSGTNWTVQALLKASNPGAYDWFGSSLAMSGNTLVVGAFQEDSNATGLNGSNNDSATDSGAAYVFVRTGTRWTQQAYLKASNTGVGDAFGATVAVSGDTLVVGARFEASSATGVNGNQADNSAASSGAAYVFVRSGPVWAQQAYLKASNTEAGDRFGYSVAVSSNTVVVGAYYEDSNATGVNGINNNNAPDSGAAYVFGRNGTIWTQRAYLKASNTGTNDYFGRTVAVSSDTAVVGAYSEDSSATGVNGNQADNTITNSGAAYAFVIPPGVPEIAVLGNNTLIPDGDVTPSTADRTDFGNQSVCSGTVVRTFTITNAGPDSLTVAAITFSGQQAVDFTRSGMVLPAAIAAGGVSTFSVTFNPSASGLRSTTLNITNDDPDENPYNFAIQGTGVDPEASVIGNGVPIADEDLTPSITDATDFATQILGAATVRTFTVTNTGNAVLYLTNLTVSGPQAAEFTVGGLTLPAAIASIGAATFTVTFNPTAPGIRSATLTLSNNDCDGSLYNFALQGLGAALGFSDLHHTPAGVLLRLQSAPNEMLSIQWNSQPGPGDWQPLTNGLTDGTGRLEFTDTGAIGQPKRFYRATRP